MSTAVVVLGLALLALFAVFAYRSFTVVEEGQLCALFVFGEMTAVLGPGINFLPPLCAKIYPIDQRTMTIDTGDRTVPVPEEYERSVREATTREPSDGVPVENEPNATAPADRTDQTRLQRAATVLGKGLFVAGAFGFVVPLAMLEQRIGFGTVDGHLFFPDPTFVEILLASLASLIVLLTGEFVGQTLGDWEIEEQE